MSRVIALPDEEATRRLGALLARHCPWQLPGERSVFLSGELGAGKTTLTAALFAACGVREDVRSPSYALVETYPFGERLGVHVDLYRLLDPAELEPLGLRDYLETNTLFVVEWPERGAGELPVPDLWLHLALAPSGRRCLLESRTDAGGRWLAAADTDLLSQNTSEIVGVSS